MGVGRAESNVLRKSNVGPESRGMLVATKTSTNGALVSAAHSWIRWSVSCSRMPGVWQHAWMRSPTTTTAGRPMMSVPLL